VGGSGAAADPSGPASRPDDGLERLSSEDLVRRMLAATGAGALAKQVIDSMATTMKQMPGLPPGFMDRFVAKANPEELMALIVPIYARSYQRDTLIATIRFYESDQGKILVAKLPDVTRETSDVGREWGRRLAAQTLSDMGVSASKKTP
jgi:uncharacterized protein